MRVSRYIAALAVACFMAGAILTCEIVWRFHVVDQLAEAGAKSNAVAARSAALTQEVLRDHDDGGAERAALIRRTRALAAAPQAAGVRKRLESVARSLGRLQGDTSPTRTRAGLERDLTAAEAFLELRAERLRDSVVAERARATEWVVGAVSLYLLALCLGWWLSLQFLLQPLRDLGDALRRRIGERAPTAPATEGASESCELVSALSEFTSDLATSLAEVEEDAKAQIDELKRINRAKSEFLASMSHEIRTPMTAILGYADLLDRPTIQPGERTECLEVIQRNGAQLLGVINDILDVSKIEAGKMTLEDVATGSTSTIAGVVTQLRHKAEAKDVRVDTTYRDAVPDSIETDPTRFRQVIFNLVENAIALCREDGAVDVEMGMGLQEPTGADATCDAVGPTTVMEVVVSASEVEISTAELEAMFDPFAQPDAAMAAAGAARLGLAIARRLAELLGGELELRSDSERACTFRFSLPVRIDDATAMVDGPPDFVDILNLDLLDDDVADLSGAYVLLVEDSVDNQELISMHLREAGAEVFIAGTAEIGLQELERTDRSDAAYQIILMDKYLPGMSGCDAIGTLRSAGNDIAIVMLTASDNAEERHECMAAGADDFVTKPVDRRTLLEAVDALLTKSATADDTPSPPMLLDL